MNIKYKIIGFIGIILLLSCNIKMKVNATEEIIDSKSTEETNDENIQSKTYIGWWIYGEQQHIFKDEKSLEEFDLEFLNEDMEKLRTLYLAVCEMEYFPMECSMTGDIKKITTLEKNILIVSDFDILHIKGCGE
jgi:hypothetical protein